MIIVEENDLLGLGKDRAMGKENIHIKDDNNSPSLTVIRITNENVFKDKEDAIIFLHCSKCLSRTQGNQDSYSIFFLR